MREIPSNGQLDEFKKQKLTQLLRYGFGLDNLEIDVERDLLNIRGSFDPYTNLDFKSFFYYLPWMYCIKKIMYYFSNNGVSSVHYTDGISDKEKYDGIYESPPDISSD